MGAPVHRGQEGDKGKPVVREQPPYGVFYLDFCQQSRNRIPAARGGRPKVRQMRVRVEVVDLCHVRLPSASPSTLLPSAALPSTLPFDPAQDKLRASFAQGKPFDLAQDKPC